MTERSTPRRAFIIHGFGATPEDHWFGWLAEELKAVGIPATIPALPEPLSPDPRRWQASLQDVVGVPDENTILVAHSLGCLTVLRHLAAQPEPWRLGSLVLVAGFVDRLPAIPALDPYIRGGADLTGLAERIDRLVVLRSDEDALVPTGHTDRLAELLGTVAQVVQGAGHFLADEGVTTLPEALRAIVDTAPLATAESVDMWP